MRVWNTSRRRVFNAVTGLVICAAPAFGGTCIFKQECFEGDGCAETAFSMEIDGNQMITDAETTPLSAIPTDADGSDVARVSVGHTASAIHVLTRQVGGDARYSTHIFDGPLMINYLGSCG